jgi:hypothetical protein
MVSTAVIFIGSVAGESELSPNQAPIVNIIVDNNRTGDVQCALRAMAAAPLRNFVENSSDEEKAYYHA